MESKLDPLQVKKDFPILSRIVYPGKPLVYLDSTATSQKPKTVIKAMDRFYEKINANIHRSVHLLAEESTDSYEASRKKIATFIGARSWREIIFTRNTTEAINLVAYSWGRKNLRAGDLVLLTEMEHHSNIVPWQILQNEIGIQLEFVPFSLQGELDLVQFEILLAKKPKLVCFTHMSNVFGTINPAKQIVAKAHNAGALTLIDGAQSVPHIPVNVVDLDADFLAFSAHKMCGPTGIGVLYGKEQLLTAMPPFLGGGDMIKKVSLTGFTPNDLPYKFEAGTPAIGEVIGFGAAIDYMNQLGMASVAAHEQSLIRYTLDRLSEFPGLKVYGPNAEKKGAVASFTMEGIHPHDIAQILDKEGVAVRAGHHCAMPLHEKLGISATARASFYIYNTQDDVDHLLKGLEKVIQVFK
jgi:cysteine desulfurase/selenocysteine lyase